MKKQMLSLALSASMLAALAPSVVMAEETVEFPENLYYNDFSENYNGLSLISISNAENPIVENGNLVIKNSTVNYFQSNTKFKVNDSDGWEEFSIAMTVEFQGVKNYLRISPYADDSDSNKYVEFVDQYGYYRDGDKNNPISSWGKKLRFKVDVNKASSSLSAFQWGSWNAVGDSILETQMSKTHTLFTGGVVIEGMWGMDNINIDELVIKDLRAKAAVTSATTGLHAGDAVTVKFSESMNTATLTADNFYITDGTNNIAIDTVAVNGSDEVAVTIPDAVDDGAAYTLVAKKEIQDADGDRLNNDKKFSITIAGTAAIFEDNLYYNDFSENMDGITIIKNDMSDDVAVSNGQLEVGQTTAWKSGVYLTIDGSEDWEEYSLETTAQITGKPGYMFFYPEYTEAAAGTQYMYMINTNGSVRNKDNNGEMTSAAWINNPIMKAKLDVNKTSSTFKLYPKSTFTSWEDAGVWGTAERTNENGKPVLSACWAVGTTYIDELKVVDLRAKAAVTSDVTALEPGDVIKVKFSEDMDTATFTTENVALKNGNETVAPAVVTAQDSTTMLVTVPEDLSSGTDYTLTIKKEVKDADGDRLNNDKLFTVTTAKSMFNVVSTYPEDGAANVDYLADVKITFDNPIDYDSDMTLTITDASSNPVAYYISRSQSTDKTMYIAFEEELEPSTTYQVSISGVASADGYAMRGTKKFSFTTKEALADYLYVNDFSNPETLSDFDIAKGSGTEAAQISDGKLVIDSGNETGKADANISIYLTLIESSHWSDYEAEIEFQSKSQYTYPQLKVRGGTVSVWAFRDSGKVGVYPSFADAYTYSKDTDPTTFNNYNSAMNKLTIRAVGNHFTYFYNGQQIAEADGDSTAAGKGTIQIGNIYHGKVDIDSIKVKDLGISATVKNPKNVAEGDEVMIEFDREMNTDTLITENVTVAAEDGTPLNITSRVANSKTIAVKLPYGIQSNEKYIITLSTDIASKDGIYLAAEKKLEIKATEKDFHIGDLKLMSAGSEITALTAGAAINAQAYVKNSSSNVQKAVLVMAVYDNTGKCVAIKTQDVTLTSGTDNTISTEGFTLPSNITGYTARIMCVDTLENIMPLVTSRLY